MGSYQFPVLEQVTGGAQVEQPAAVDHFGGLGRETYMQQRVHRRLHGQAVKLSDDQLWELGQLSFNQQFNALETSVSVPGMQPQSVYNDPFQGVGREGYMQHRVHRRLHSQAALLSDQELLEP